MFDLLCAFIELEHALIESEHALIEFERALIRVCISAILLNECAV